MEIIREIGVDLPVFVENGWRLRAYMIGSTDMDEYARELTITGSRSLRNTCMDPLEPSEPLFEDDPLCRPCVVFRAPEEIEVRLSAHNQDVLQTAMAGMSAAQASRIKTGPRAPEAVYGQRAWVRSRLAARNIKGAVAKGLVLRQLQMPQPLKAEPEATVLDMYGLALSALEAEANDIRRYIGFKGRLAVNTLLSAGRSALCGEIKATTAQAIGQAFAQGLFVVGRPYVLPYRQDAAPEAMPMPMPRRMPFRARLTAADEAEILAASDAGTPQPVIAKKYGVSPSAISLLLSDLRRRSGPS